MLPVWLYSASAARSSRVNEALLFFSFAVRFVKKKFRFTVFPFGLQIDTEQMFVYNITILQMGRDLLWKGQFYTAI